MKNKPKEQGWPPNWLNNCALCERHYKEAEEKVQSEPNRYELKEKKDCNCCHHINSLICSQGPWCEWKKKYINENHKELDEQGRTHDQVCGGGTSQGGSSIPVWSEFYKVKLGQVCEICQETINSLEDWEVKGKEKITEACGQGEHYKVGGSWIAQGRGGDWKVTHFVKLPCCGKGTEENSFGDVKPCPTCSKNNSPNKQQLQILLSTLNQLQQFFNANDIHSITNQNGNLVITFNQNQTNPNSPPPQTITEEELSETSTLMEPEQKSMLKKFKEWLKKNGKNAINKQELEQEINKLKTQTEQNPDKPIWPLIIGGIGIIAVVGIVFTLIKNRKTKKL